MNKTIAKFAARAVAVFVFASVAVSVAQAYTAFPGCVDPLNPEACKTMACCLIPCDANCAGSAKSQCYLACTERHP